MNYLDFSDDLLKEAERHLTYDMNIPFQYRVMSKLLWDYNYNDAKRFMEANADYFADEYSYLVLDMAVECECIDENGISIRINYEKGREKYHIYRPTQEAIDFIQYLLENGANPHLPESFNQWEHIDDKAEDGEQQTGSKFDYSEIIQLFNKYR